MMTLITGFTCPPTIHFEFITKCDKCYYKVRQVLQSVTILLQSATGITKCYDYYKVRQYNGILSMSHMPFKAFMFKDMTSSTHVRTSYLIPGTSGWAPLFKYRRHWKRLNRNKSRKQNKMVTGVYSEMTGSSATRLFKQAEKQTTQARQSYVRTVSIFANLSALSRIQKQFFILFSSYRFKKVASKIRCCEIPRLLLLNGREYFYV